MKLVSGVGINDADYPVTKEITVDGKRKIVWRCPYYLRWSSMLRRCYYEPFQLKWPSYVGCTTVKEWHRFSSFKAWMETQDWEDKHLDKDLLIPGNKIYGPDTCVFVDQKINKFLLDCQSSRGEQPLGVSLDKASGKYRAMCSSWDTGKSKHLGMFDSSEEAHNCWRIEKFRQAKILASGESDPRIVEALMSRYYKAP